MTDTTNTTSAVPCPVTLTFATQARLHAALRDLGNAPCRIDGLNLAVPGDQPGWLLPYLEHLVETWVLSDAAACVAVRDMESQLLLVETGQPQGIPAVEPAPPTKE